MCRKPTIYKNTCGIKLNYLTLSISEPAITKDFENHRTENQNRKSIFWPTQFLVVLFLILSLNAFRVEMKVRVVQITSLTSFVGMTIMWPIIRKFRPKYSKFVFGMVYTAFMVG